MEFIVAADTDIGISKTTNQDSVCIKTARTKKGRAALIMVCDGMGGLSKGELASATVIRSFSDWFEMEFPFELNDWDWDAAALNIERKLKNLNLQILDYGQDNNVQLGTTVTGMLIIGMQYILFHVGDTRIYKITDKVKQLTTDHTFIRRELDKGTITPEEAAVHPKRNALLQCVGASQSIIPEIKTGDIENGVNYMLCSDGFRHVLSEEEILQYMAADVMTTKKNMQKTLRGLIEVAKQRNEKDNISAAIIRPDI